MLLRKNDAGHTFKGVPGEGNDRTTSVCEIASIYLVVEGCAGAAGAGAAAGYPP